jgi:hypothetical protein
VEGSEPSNSSCQPAAFSAAVSVLGAPEAEEPFDAVPSFVAVAHPKTHASADVAMTVGRIVLTVIMAWLGRPSAPGAR